MPLSIDKAAFSSFDSADRLATTFANPNPSLPIEMTSTPDACLYSLMVFITFLVSAFLFPAILTDAVSHILNITMMIFFI
jgi:hypothetical protein